MIRGSIRFSDVKLYPGEPERFITDMNGPVMHELDRRMARAQAGARSMVRVRTGRLRASIRRNRGATKRHAYVEVIAGGRARTFHYTMFEHDGTRPHIIRPRRKKALRFHTAGVVVFATKVRHPGTRGSRFLERALPLAGG